MSYYAKKRGYSYGEEHAEYSTMAKRRAAMPLGVTKEHLVVTKQGTDAIGTNIRFHINPSPELSIDEKTTAGQGCFSLPATGIMPVVRGFGTPNVSDRVSREVMVMSVTLRFDIESRVNYSLRVLCFQEA